MKDKKYSLRQSIAVSSGEPYDFKDMPDNNQFITHGSLSEVLEKHIFNTIIVFIRHNNPDAKFSDLDKFSREIKEFCDKIQSKIE